MFTIQQQKTSTIRTVFVILVLELIFVEKSFSNQYTCGDRNRGRISYYTLNSADVNWDEAWRKCNDENFTLPVICNQHEQDAFISHLRANGRYPSAWTSARKIVFKEWKWVDGQSYTSRVLDAAADPHYTRAFFDLAGNHYTATDPRHKRHYLCHYSGSSCMHQKDIQLKTGCVRSSNDERSWFDARNQCVDNGGDIAKVDDDDLATLRNSTKLKAPRGYWIGLRNNAWRWVRHKAETADDSGGEVKYTYWENLQPETSGECISIDALNGGWTTVRCTEGKKVVCQTSLGSDEAASSTSSPIIIRRPTFSSKSSSTTMSSKSSSTRSRYTTSSTLLHATTSAMSSIWESPTQSTIHIASQGLLYSGVGAGIAILIICIIIIIFVVRYKRKPHKNIDQSKVTNSSELNKLQLSPNKPPTSPANASSIASVNPLVAGTDDALGVYAEITLEPLNQSEDEAQIQQPGVLYAALEFQKEPTYLEPNHKNANASDQTKAGPMGDIYAIPDAKSRTGNEPANHPLLVTSQGDVYALPVKNSKSPTANSPVGGIYANL